MEKFFDFLSQPRPSFSSSLEKKTKSENARDAFIIFLPPVYKLNELRKKEKGKERKTKTERKKQERTKERGDERKKTRRDVFLSSFPLRFRSLFGVYETFLSVFSLSLSLSLSLSRPRSCE